MHCLHTQIASLVCRLQELTPPTTGTRHSNDLGDHGVFSDNRKRSCPRAEYCIILDDAARGGRVAVAGAIRGDC
jgi:hypothetical protein